MDAQKMTTQEKMSFESWMEETYSICIEADQYCSPKEKWIGAAKRAREQTIAEILKILRSGIIPMYIDGGEMDGDFDPCAAADWLESKLKEPTVVPKDPSFVLPEYY